MLYGAEVGTGGVQSTDKEPETPIGLVSESQAPLFSTQVNLEPIELVERGGTVSQKKSRLRFTPEQDIVLIQSWLNVSKDPAVGTNQKVGSFWSKVKVYYNKHRGKNFEERGTSQLKARWHRLNAVVQKFACCHKQAMKRQERGSSEIDIISDAFAIYSQDEDERFGYEYAWRLLKDEPKWKESLKECSTKRKKLSASEAYSSSSSPPTPTSGEHDPASPTLVHLTSTTTLFKSTAQPQLPPTNPSMRVLPTDKELETPIGSIPMPQVPPFSTQVNLETVELVEQEGAVSKKKSRERFTPEQDKVLIQSWLNISKDPVVGTNQKVESFWSKVKVYYNKHRDKNFQERGTSQLKARWHRLNAMVQKFAGCYKQAVKRQKRESSEIDIISDAFNIYSQDEDERFGYEYAWRLLKDEPKWKESLKECSSKRKKISASEAYSSSSNPPTPTCSEHDPASPTLVHLTSTKSMFKSTAQPQLPPPNPAMLYGAEIGTGGVLPTDKELETPIGSIPMPQVPPFSTQVNLETVELVEQEGAVSKKRSRERFTPEQDKVLIQSWLNISKDSVVGVNQKVESFWFRVKDYYNKHLDKKFRERGTVQLKSRWHRLNAAVQKFVGCYKQVAKRQKRGSFENDIISDAYILYSQDEGERFGYEYAWRLLKDEPKWKESSHECSSKRTKIFVSEAYSSSSNPQTPTSSEYDPASPSLVCPNGKRAAKRKARAEPGEESYGNVGYDKLKEVLDQKFEVMAEFAREFARFNRIKDEEIKVEKEKVEVEKEKLKFKEIQMLSMDTCKMTERQLKAHEILCNMIREKYGIN